MLNMVKLESVREGRLVVLFPHSRLNLCSYCLAWLTWPIWRADLTSKLLVMEAQLNLVFALAQPPDEYPNRASTPSIDALLIVFVEHISWT